MENINGKRYLKRLYGWSLQNKISKRRIKKKKVRNWVRNYLAAKSWWA